LLGGLPAASSDRGFNIRAFNILLTIKGVILGSPTEGGGSVQLTPLN
jgi:hypothetical protein